MHVLNKLKFRCYDRNIAYNKRFLPQVKKSRRTLKLCVESYARLRRHSKNIVLLFLEILNNLVMSRVTSHDNVTSSVFKEKATNTDKQFKKYRKKHVVFPVDELTVR